MGWLEKVKEKSEILLEKSQQVREKSGRFLKEHMPRSHHPVETDGLNPPEAPPASGREEKRPEVSLNKRSMKAVKSSVFSKPTVEKPKPGTALPKVLYEMDTNVLDQLLARVMKIPDDVGKYQYLRDMQLDNPQNYWPLLVRHSATLMPFIYTPTVGRACQEYSTLPVREVGTFIQYPRDKGRIKEILLEAQARNGADIRAIVVTDGERILGLGDQGYGGMGISEGKIQLYTACAGVPPEACLPVCLDVGTNREELRSDERYRGRREERLSNTDRKEYDAFVHEFMEAVASFPHISLQFEDFGNTTAFDHLHRYQLKQCCFNDDIQGTACITLAGLVSAMRVTGVPLIKQRVLFLGAGEAGTGIGELIAMYFVKHAGLSIEEARKRCFFVDSRGLVCKERPDKLAHHKQPFAHDVPFVADLLSAVRETQPTAIIGVSTVPGAFNQEVVGLMSRINQRPIIFPLSNPTVMAECTFAQCMEWSEGRAVFASGSPFAPLEVNGKLMRPAQCNNAYVFPACVLAAVALRSSRIDDQVFMVAAEALARLSSVDELAQGLLFPPLSDILEISTHVAAQVAEYMIDAGYAEKPADLSDDMEAWISSKMWPHVHEIKLT